MLLDGATSTTRYSYLLTSAPGDMDLDVARETLLVALPGTHQIALVHLRTGVVTTADVGHNVTSVAAGPGAIAFAATQHDDGSGYWAHDLVVVDTDANTIVRTYAETLYYPKLVHHLGTSALYVGEQGSSPSRLARSPRGPSFPVARGTPAPMPPRPTSHRAATSSRRWLRRASPYSASIRTFARRSRRTNHETVATRPPA